MRYWVQSAATKGKMNLRETILSDRYVTYIPKTVIILLISFYFKKSSRTEWCIPIPSALANSSKPGLHTGIMS